MVIEEINTGGNAPGVSQDQIDNIMGSITNTGAVKMNHHKKKLRQRFDIIKKLGQGTYGKVQLGINKDTGQEVAIKTIKKSKIEAEADLIRIRREVQIMSSVQHPNIIHIYEVFENKEKMVLVMEFAAGGELYDYLSERKVLLEEEARRIFRQVSTAVYYCHKHKICHRDLKLENILLDEKGNAKIADFGLSNVFDEQRLLATFCGSPLYASPEIVKGTPYQGPEVDCWSLGVLLYTLVYGAMPFDGSNFKRLVKQIGSGDYFEPKKSSTASALIREMLTVCPERRATIDQICNHWWVNEGYEDSCLNLAENLANQTPVRLDVLLSLTPASVTAEQLVVPSVDDIKIDRVARSHSVGSIRGIENTEAERRILDMVAAGGAAALMPSPTRTITPAQSPVQVKRKLEMSISTSNASVGVNKKEKQGELTQNLKSGLSKLSISEMDVDACSEKTTSQTKYNSKNQNASYEQEATQEQTFNATKLKNDKTNTVAMLKAVNEAEELPQKIMPLKVIKKFVNKYKTSDLVAAVNRKPSPNKVQSQLSQLDADIDSREETHPDQNIVPTDILTSESPPCLIDTALVCSLTRRTNTNDPPNVLISSAILAENQFEHPASVEHSPLQSDQKTGDISGSEKFNLTKQGRAIEPPIRIEDGPSHSQTTFPSFSLEKARRSMENSIALINKAKNESFDGLDILVSNKNVGSSCSDTAQLERQNKLRNARQIIGHAINPSAARKPLMFGLNGRSVSGGVVPSATTSHAFKKCVMRQVSSPEASVGNCSPPIVASKLNPTDIAIPTSHIAQISTPAVKTSRAEITLKSATLPRRKTKLEMRMDIKPQIAEQLSPVESKKMMHFSTEMKHKVHMTEAVRQADTDFGVFAKHKRALSLEPQTSELQIQINTPEEGTVSASSSARKSRNIFDTQANTMVSYTQPSNSSHPKLSQIIKKSPREFIIPIAFEGGGFVTPRADSLEPSESFQSISTSLGISRPIVIGSRISDNSVEDEFKQLSASIPLSKDNDDIPRYAMHRLRSSRPMKTFSQDATDSVSSAEEDDEDGFEILTAENLFSTLLQRVRALTNRMNVNNDLTAFPQSALLNNIRQKHTPFWQQKQYTSRSSANPTWRLSRDIGADIDEDILSRTGATLPRGFKKKSFTTGIIPRNKTGKNKATGILESSCKEHSTALPIWEDAQNLDLTDLDLSRLYLTNEDIVKLSAITPGLPKCFQEQLLSKLPSHQARKLVRTLSLNDNYYQTEGCFYNSTSPFADEKRGINISVSETECRSSNTCSKSRYTSCFCSRCHGCNNKFRSALYSMVFDQKYHHCPPHSSKAEQSGQISRNIIEMAFKSQSSLLRRNSLGEVSGRPPTGCVSPPSLEKQPHQTPAQTHLARFRPDFFDFGYSSRYLRHKKEREAQTILQHIRANSRDRNRRNGCDRSRSFGHVENIADNFVPLRLCDDTDSRANQSPHLRCVGHTSLDRLRASEDVYASLGRLHTTDLYPQNELSKIKVRNVSTIREQQTSSPNHDEYMGNKTFELTKTTQNAINDAGVGEKLLCICGTAKRSKSMICNFGESSLEESVHENTGTTVKKDTKLIRLKPHSHKDCKELISLGENMNNVTNIMPIAIEFHEGSTQDRVLSRPKSFPASKIKQPRYYRIANRNGKPLNACTELHLQCKLPNTDQKEITTEFEGAVPTNSKERLEKPKTALDKTVAFPETLAPKNNNKKTKLIKTYNDKFRYSNASDFEKAIRSFRECSVTKLADMTHVKSAINADDICDTLNNKFVDIVCKKRDDIRNTRRKTPKPTTSAETQNRYVNILEKRAAKISDTVMNSNTTMPLGDEIRRQSREESLSIARNSYNDNVAKTKNDVISLNGSNFRNLPCNAISSNGSPRTTNKTAAQINHKAIIVDTNKTSVLDNGGNFRNKNYILHSSQIDEHRSTLDTNKYSKISNPSYNDTSPALIIRSLSANNDLRSINVDSDQIIEPPHVSTTSHRTSPFSSVSPLLFAKHLPTGSIREGLNNKVELHTESVIDRIKRRSFYCRFNEKKPRRQSTIVGPSAQYYYRESATKLLARLPDGLDSEEWKKKPLFNHLEHQTTYVTERKKSAKVENVEKNRCKESCNRAETKHADQKTCTWLRGDFKRTSICSWLPRCYAYPDLRIGTGLKHNLQHTSFCRKPNITNPISFYTGNRSLPTYTSDALQHSSEDQLVESYNYRGISLSKSSKAGEKKVAFSGEVLPISNGALKTPFELLNTPR